LSGRGWRELEWKRRLADQSVCAPTDRCSVPRGGFENDPVWIVGDADVVAIMIEMVDLNFA
jgi:hypothetical protein